jgi:hypothetical protein
MILCNDHAHGDVMRLNGQSVHKRTFERETDGAKWPTGEKPVEVALTMSQSVSASTVKCEPQDQGRIENRIDSFAGYFRLSWRGLPQSHANRSQFAWIGMNMHDSTLVHAWHVYLPIRFGGQFINQSPRVDLVVEG